MEILNLTNNNDNVTLVPRELAIPGGQPYSPGVTVLAHDGNDTVTRTDFNPNEGDAFEIVSGDVDVNNLNVIASGDSTLITDKISGQMIAIVQGIAPETVANDLGIGSVNSTRRLRIVATSGATANGFNSAVLNPLKSWNNFISSGLSVNGFFNTVNGNIDIYCQVLTPLFLTT